MLLRDLIEVTSANLVIFVSEEEVFESKGKAVVCYEGQNYFGVQDDTYIPNGIPFDPDFDTLEVIAIENNIYKEKDGDSSAVIEVYVG